MTTYKKYDFASRCKACNSIMNTFFNTKPLPDGTFDDLCTACKGASYESNNCKYTDYVHEHLGNDGDFEGFIVEDL